MDIYLKVLNDKALLACVTFYFCRDRGLDRRYTIHPPQPASVHYLIHEGILHEITQQVIDYGFGYTCYEYYRQTQCLDDFDTMLLHEAQGKERILDLCCGAGATVHSLITVNPQIVYAIDHHAADLSILHGTLPFISDEFSGEIVIKVGDAHDIDLDDEAVDYVVCRAALQYLHVPTALKEVYRVLKRDGSLYLLVHGSGYILNYIFARRKWNSPHTASFLSGALQGHHSLSKIKFLSMNALHRKLREAGFENIRMIRSGKWDVLGTFPIYYGVVAEKQ